MKTLTKLYFQTLRELLSCLQTSRKHDEFCTYYAFQDIDAIYMVEVGEKELKDEKLFERIKKTSIPVLLLLNKIDLVDQDDVSNQIEIWKKLVPNRDSSYFCFK